MKIHEMWKEKMMSVMKTLYGTSLNYDALSRELDKIIEAKKDKFPDLFMRNLYIFLWSLLLLVPGIIKSFEYYMVTYLMAEFPDMSREEAFRLSKKMMMGNKMDVFILELSFFGWYILTAFTCGILGLFYVTPYVHATKAELYIKLRKNIY